MDWIVCSAGGSKQMILTSIRFWYPYAVRATPGPTLSHASLKPQENLNLEGSLLSLLALGDACRGLDAQQTTTPPLARILVLLKVSLLDGGHKLGELGLVLGADLGQGENGSGLGNKLANR